MHINEAMEPSVLDAFMRGVVRGQYHLLFGAGASFGGLSADGRPLPGAKELAEEIACEFGLPDASAQNLRRLYALAQNRRGVSGQLLEEYLKARFVGTTPPEWMRDLVTVPWGQLWTLNVDDAVERAYVTHSGSARQRALSVSWTEHHRTARLSESEVLLVHLHGKASRATRSEELIFDISGYVHAVAERHRWHRLFGDAYQDNPFLVVGASLDAEIDLQVVLEQGRLGSPEYPSVIVVKEAEDLQLEEYRRYGLTPVLMAAGDFFQAVRELLSRYTEELAPMESVGGEETPREAFSFLSQWRPLGKGSEQADASDSRHDFYAGHEPEWRDVLAELPAARSIVGSLIEIAVRSLATGQHSLQLLVGDSFSGKSTALLMVAAGLIERGFSPFLFSSTFAPDVDAITWWCRRYPKSVLLIDNAADFAHDILALVGSTESPSVRCIMVERTWRAEHAKAVLVATPYVSVVARPQLNGREVDALIGKLGENKRLGVLTGWSRAQQLEYFNERRRELFSAMADLERGRGFLARIRDEYAAVPSEGRDLLGVTALVARQGYGLPLGVATAAGGVTLREVSALLTTSLADLLVVKGANIIMRHRVAGEMIVEECLGKSQRFDLTVQIAVAVAPYLSPAAISASSVHYRIARAVMSSRDLMTLLQGDTELVFDFFARIEAAHGWNARFWEQRALVAADLNLFEPAFSWAREAVARRADAFTYNTVGTVLMRRALSEQTVARWPTDSFEMAVEALESARKLEGANSEYPFETFFRYTLRLAEGADLSDRALREQLRQLWLNWRLAVLALAPDAQLRLGETVRVTGEGWSRLGLD